MSFTRRRDGAKKARQRQVPCPPPPLQGQRMQQGLGIEFSGREVTMNQRFSVTLSLWLYLWKLAGTVLSLCPMHRHRG